jgi:GH35 family endo-1,4-beta-xylanase
VSGVGGSAVAGSLGGSSGNGGSSGSSRVDSSRCRDRRSRRIVISELDVQICASTQAAQQTRYHDLLAACIAEPACTAVTVWGITDKFSWLNGQTCASAMGLLFDASYAKKPAYTGVLDALNGR